MHASFPETSEHVLDMAEYKQCSSPAIFFNQHRTTVVLHYFHFSLLSLLTAITHDTQIHENIKEMLVALLVILSRRPFRMVQRMQMRRSSLLTSSVHETQLKMKLKIYEHEEQQIDEREYSKKKE